MITITLSIKSPLPTLCQRGVIAPPLEKGDEGGFYQQFFFQKVQFLVKVLFGQIIF